MTRKGCNLSAFISQVISLTILDMVVFLCVIKKTPFFNTTKIIIPKTPTELATK